MPLSSVFINSDAELDAINDVLSAIGEPAVTSTTGADDNADVQNAYRCLSNANREVQSKGWTFNTFTNYTLTPDIFTKNIKYLDTYLRVMAPDGASSYINRAGNFYDMTNDTDQFDSAITVKMIYLQDYDAMPTCFRKLIVTKAARAFNARFYGDTVIDAILTEEETEARIMCDEYEWDFGKFNMLDGDAFTSGQITRS